jgi:streptogramin lyase
MRSGTLLCVALCVCVVWACSAGGGGAPPVAVSRPVSPPTYTTWTVPTAAGIRMPPVSGDRLAMAVGLDGTVGFASPFVHGTYAGGKFAWSFTGPFGAGPVTYGRGTNGALYSGDLLQDQSGPPYVRDESSGNSWVLLPAACAGVAACNPFPQEYPIAILPGPDAATWALTLNGMVRLNPDATTTILPLSTPYAGPRDVALGADGAFWVAEAAGTIERIPISGAASRHAVAGHPMRIAAGADGALWFLDGDGRVRRITVLGNVTTVVASVSGGVTAGDAIASGGDGAIWFTEAASNKLARITPSGTLTEFAVPDAVGTPTGVTSAPDGSLWFLEQDRGLTLVHAVLSPPVTGS